MPCRRAGGGTSKCATEADCRATSVNQFPGYFSGSFPRHSAPSPKGTAGEPVFGYRQPDPAYGELVEPVWDMEDLWRISALGSMTN